MTTFGRIVSGSVTDVCIGEDVTSALSTYYAPAYVAEFGAQAWVQIPNGTISGSTTSDGTTFTPPNPPAQVKVPLELSVGDFANFCYAQLGAITMPSGTLQQQIVAGITRRGQMLLACKNTNDPATFEAYTRFMTEQTYLLSDVEVFLTIIGPSPGSGITNAQENAAIIGNWPST